MSEADKMFEELGYYKDFDNMIHEYRKNGKNGKLFEIDFWIEEKQVSTKLYWDSIEYIIINKYSICIFPKNFAHFAIFISINSKDEVYKALKKYNKLNLLIDNSINANK